FIGEGEAKRRMKIFPPVSVMDPARSDAIPGAAYLCEDGSWCVMTGQRALRVSEIQIEGKRRMSVSQFCKDYQIPQETALS
ncbi:MAG: methionyl-tRNA formyltransferase, partial [Verrucomicrobiales bacterium]